MVSGIFICLMILSVILALKSIFIVSENERAVVLRFGKFIALRKSDMHFSFPLIDVPIKVNLSQHLPEWQSLDTEDVDERIKKMVIFDPNPKKYK